MYLPVGPAWGLCLYVPIDPPSTANLWGSIPFVALVFGVSLLHTLGLGLILGFLRDTVHPFIFKCNCVYLYSAKGLSVCLIFFFDLLVCEALI